MQIARFYVVGRLDRFEGPKAGYGGVAVYVRNSVANIGLLSYSKTTLRMLCFLHLKLGMFFIGNWYRPPDDGGTSISSLADEMSKLRKDVVGVILAGDMNIHHRMWLRYSREN